MRDPVIVDDLTEDGLHRGNRDKLRSLFRYITSKKPCDVYIHQGIVRPQSLFDYFPQIQKWHEKVNKSLKES